MIDSLLTDVSPKFLGELRSWLEQHGFVTRAVSEVDHNGVAVSNRPRIDFEDANSFVWSIADDAANSRSVVKISTVNGLTPGRGADIPGGTPITVNHEVHAITGGGTLSQINGFSDGAQVTLIAANLAFSINSSLNVWATSAGGTRTVPLHAAVRLVYDSTLATWHVAGVGS